MIKKLLAEKFSGKKTTFILLIIGFIGIALIFLSDIFQPSAKSSKQTQTSSDSSGNFEIQTEKRLESIIGEINGVGRVQVLVTVQSGVENIYETDSKVSYGKTQTAGNEDLQQSNSSESSHVIVDNENGGQRALLTKQIQPEILGVVVVCDGGGSPDVRESVVDTVSTALGIATNRISVNKMEPKQN